MAEEEIMEFSHKEAIALTKDLVESALYHYGADYVECSDCSALIDENDGSIVHNLPDCKVAAVEARLDELGVGVYSPQGHGRPLRALGLAEKPGFSGL